ncbi:phosphonate metabolism protein/1,5-bisphosphokinase (PRPP-forming) PhnN [Mangrovibrevibacter kandeliae]|uniref:phosphonate metabolism protein/1,5-bisphosphokinase (PRPP-forming) PhnN n=1 Tax=Mangrovibrevibacter kandeliae TaxID=2968473 RepID=UPI002117C50B|nr:phosphonate metabolism protein/1,5-bisphosphokinase (PRPP-forming) PhnN [Aurantimonas sp. CSK15Z-1]
MSPDAPPAIGRTGCFVAVVGPSGAGKDTLLRLAGRALAGRDDVVFARRTVTREAVVDVEDHDVLDPEAFEAAERAGAFCLSWRAHGLAYGIPHEVDVALDAGATVVANLSRRALAEAASRFPRFAVVEISAPKAVLVARIAARGRESPEEIEARLTRAVALEVPATAERFCRIDNDGSPDDGAARLVAFLTS